MRHAVTRRTGEDRRIDDVELPVTHRTIREGSPHKLVLTKTADLHRRDAERRETLATSLDVVEQFLAAS